MCAKKRCVLVDRPTQLICISDIYLSTDKYKKKAGQSTECYVQYIKYTKLSWMQHIDTAVTTRFCSCCLLSNLLCHSVTRHTAVPISYFPTFYATRASPHRVESTWALPASLHACRQSKIHQKHQNRWCVFKDDTDVA